MAKKNGKSTSLLSPLRTSGSMNGSSNAQSAKSPADPLGYKPKR